MPEPTITEAEQRALYALASSLAEFASPVVAPKADLDMNAMDWMDQQLSEQPLMKSPPKRTSLLLQRSTTPIMSNSSSKRSLRKAEDVARVTVNSENDDSMEDYMETEPAPVQTPLQRILKPSSTPGQTLGTELKKKYHSSLSLSQHSFRRYHDTLWGYLDATRRLHIRREFDQQEKQLITGDDERFETVSLSPSTADRQGRAEVEYCKTLSHLGYSLSSEDTEMVEEGHVWSLLADLCTLGPEALIWDNDSASCTQHDTAVEIFLHSLTSKVRSTPKELLESLTSMSSNPPMPLKRTYQLVRWIQSCLEQESKGTKFLLPQSSSIAVPSRSHPDDQSLPSLVSEMDGKLAKTVMQSCLCKVLEGNVSGACNLARSSGFSLKAALWSGGEPYGYDQVMDDVIKTVDKVPIGNPNRFLWKRQVWKMGRILVQQYQEQQLYGASASTAEEEAALNSILANDVKSALENPLIRSSWIKSLCVMLVGVWERVQDEILHRHSSNRRRIAPPGFPGCQYEEEENEQLMETAGLDGMKEAQITTFLASNPYLKHRRKHEEGGDGKLSYKSAMLAFTVGRSAITEFCAKETERLLSTRKQTLIDGDGVNDFAAEHGKALRFFTHLVLFLDSNRVPTSQVPADDFTRNKDQILFQYVRYLESRPELWHMLALYVSLLPKAKILEYYPTILVRVLGSPERKLMMSQIRDRMSQLELPIIRKVVRRLLKTSSFCEESGETLDKIKCKSLEWLLQHEEHFGDALICSNIYMRILLVVEDEDKMDLAVEFLNEYLPPALAQRVFEIANDPNTDSDTEYMIKVGNARLEHLAYVSYLDAYRAFENWKVALKRTPTTTVNSNIFVSAGNLNTLERDIANESSQKSWVREKKELFAKITAIAEQARSAFYKVLTHPGGWLSQDGHDSDIFHDSDNEENVRKEEISNIRSRHLVLVVGLYHQVCEETAAWISRSFDDAGTVGIARNQVISLLDSEISEGSDASQSSFSPFFWYNHAMNLAELVASDTYGIYKAFPPGDLKDLLIKLSETSLAELLIA